MSRHQLSTPDRLLIAKGLMRVRPGVAHWGCKLVNDDNFRGIVDEVVLLKRVPYDELANDCFQVLSSIRGLR